MGIITVFRDYPTDVWFFLEERNIFDEEYEDELTYS
jgi:hypothetical protein